MINYKFGSRFGGGRNQNHARVFSLSSRCYPAAGVDGENLGIKSATIRYDENKGKIWLRLVDREPVTGGLIILPPTGGETGYRNIDLTFQLQAGSRQTGLGVAFDYSTGFKLPNGWGLTVILMQAELDSIAWMHSPLC